MSHHRISFRRFLREVTKFSPSALLPLLAQEGSQQALRQRESPDRLLDGASPVTPWAIIEIARESIVHGVHGGQRLPNRPDLCRLCGFHANLDDPLSDSPQSSLEQFLVRIGFEQFRWQLSEFEELARSHALFVEAARQVPEATAFSDERWRAALGCSVDEFVGIGFFLYVWSVQHEGWVDLEWMALPNFAEVRAHFTPALVDAVMPSRLCASFSEFRALDPSPSAMPSAVAEHRFNPLTARPFVRMRDGRTLAPHPLLVLHRLGVSGLYYDRCREPGFTDQLGRVFEAYVGMQLTLIAVAEVRPAVSLGRSDESVDWIVVLPDVVLLVEAKATRLTERARAGLDQLDTDRDRTLGRAYAQIDRTASLIRDGHPALAFVPTDRPMRGLVATLEPYWNAVTGFGPRPTTSIPTTVASIREVEYLGAAGHVMPVGPALLALTGTHSNQALAHALGEDSRTRNPILDRGWDAVFEACQLVEDIRERRRTSRSMRAR